MLWINYLPFHTGQPIDGLSCLCCAVVSLLFVPSIFCRPGARRWPLWCAIPVGPKLALEQWICSWRPATCFSSLTDLEYQLITISYSKSTYEQDTHHTMGLCETPRRFVVKRCRYTSLDRFEDALVTALGLMPHCIILNQCKKKAFQLIYLLGTTLRKPLTASFRHNNKSVSTIG